MKLRGLLPFILFPTIIFLLSYFGTPLTALTPLAIIGGFLFAGLAEYFLHRVMFHNRRLPRKLKKLISHGHIYHHRYPDRVDDLILPVFLVLPASLILLGSFVLLFGWSYAFWFYIGVMFSYFLYEFVHYSTHHIPLNLPYFKQMQAYHLRHHKDRPNSKFMITNPFWDWVFGTYK